MKVQVVTLYRILVAGRALIVSGYYCLEAEGVEWALRLDRAKFQDRRRQGSADDSSNVRAYGMPDLRNAKSGTRDVNREWREGKS